MGAAGWGRGPEAGPSLQLDQQKQEQALALLRRRAELEVWETHKALDELLSKHQLVVSLAPPRACPSEPACSDRQRSWSRGRREHPPGPAG